MATQLASLGQKPIRAAFYGDRRSKSSLSGRGRTVSREQTDGEMNEELWKAEFQRRHPSGDSRLLGFKYLKRSVSSVIVNKAKAIYDGVSGDFVKTPKVRNEQMLVDPYFSIPVVPATTSTPYA